MAKIYIDSSNRNVLHIRLTAGDHMWEKTVNSTIHNSQQILPQLDILLQDAGIALADITDIHVQTGPGSFTGIRVGVITAQTLSVVLNIPINGLPAGSLPELNYGPDIWNLEP
jgi:tRNA threonylcarbamoyladenosine biosynthesis protein TsaB